MDKLSILIQWFKIHQGKVTYSQNYRNGPSSYDCSSAVYSALRYAGYSLDISWNGNTESLFGTLEKLGWKQIPRSQAQAGDIFIWGRRGFSAGNFGHTGVFTSNKNILHCNYGYNGITENDYDLIRSYNGKPVETIYTHPKANTPSQAGKPSQPSQVANTRIPEVATFTVGVDSLNIRRKPSLSGEIVDSYTRGQSFRYDSKIDAEGYRWVHYIGRSGLDCWVAVRELKTNRLYGSIK